MQLCLNLSWQGAYEMMILGSCLRRNGCNTADCWPKAQYKMKAKRQEGEELDVYLQHVVHFSAPQGTGTGTGSQPWGQGL